MNRFIIIYFAVFKLVYCESDANVVNIDKLLIDYSWASTYFHYPNEKANEEAMRSGLYEPGAASPYDVDIQDYNKMTRRIFITTPRTATGIPATVGYLSTNSSENGIQYIVPYPNLDIHTDHGNCDHIVNVFRIKIDECNRLWVMDTGFWNGKIQCPPKLLLFDLSTDQLISNYTFDNTILTNDTRLVTPIIDINNHECDNAFVYIPDNSERNFIVYDHKKQKSWRIESELFRDYPEYNFPDYSMGAAADKFVATLGPIDKNGDRILYFHSLDSSLHGMIKTSAIKNSTRFATNFDINFDGVKVLPYERAASGTEVMNKYGILFYRSVYGPAIHCWTLEDHQGFQQDMSDKILEGITKLDHAASLKIINTQENRELLLITSIPHIEFINGLSQPLRINYRILGGYVDELIAGTKCW